MLTEEVLFELMRSSDVRVQGHSDATLGDARQLLAQSLETGEWWDGPELVGVALQLTHDEFSVGVDRTRPDLWAEVLDWADAHGGRTTQCLEADAEQLAELAARGWHPAYGAFDLRRPSAPVDVEPAFSGWTPEGAEAVHALVYSVWTTVEGHVARPFDEWQRLFLTGDAIDPALQVVSRTEAGIDAVALCRIWDDGLGWVSQLAVAAGAQGLGLGRRVLLEAVRRLQDAGADGVGLSVNAPNAGALALYESCGFARTAAWITSRRT